MSQINTFNDIRSLQRTLNKLVAWVNKGDIDFNVYKFQYKMNHVWIKSADKEKDFEILMSKDLKFWKQYLLTKTKINLNVG